MLCKLRVISFQVSEDMIVYSISNQVFGGKSRYPGRNPFPNIWTEPQKLVRHCEVTAILVLYGLPR
jgi:hypothetical protein